MGSIKGRNGMDLTEAEDIKKSWQEYTEELYKEDLHDPDNHSGVTTIWNWWNLENSAVAIGMVKISFHSNPKERQCKECSNYHTTALISHASKIMLKILQARLQQLVNFQMFKLVLEKAEEPEIKLPTSVGSSKSKRVPEKHLFLLY